MPTYTVEGTASAGFIPAGDVPEAVEIIGEIAAGQLGSRHQVETEVDLMLSLIRQFPFCEPDEVMQACAAISARCTELCILLHRVESKYREYRQVRTQQVQRVLEEVERQHRIASRLIEVRRQDIDLMR